MPDAVVGTARKELNSSPDRGTAVLSLILDLGFKPEDVKDGDKENRGQPYLSRAAIHQEGAGRIPAPNQQRWPDYCRLGEAPMQRQKPPPQLPEE
jgi:hypothetical protein